MIRVDVEPREKVVEAYKQDTTQALRRIGRIAEEFSNGTYNGTSLDRYDRAIANYLAVTGRHRYGARSLHVGPFRFALPGKRYI